MEGKGQHYDTAAINREMGKTDEVRSNIEKGRKRGK